MEIERLISDKLAVNKVVFAVTTNAYNTLKMLGQKAIERKGLKKLKRKRIGCHSRFDMCCQETGQTWQGINI